MYHKDLIGRYYDTLIDRDYLYVLRSDRIQHNEIQGLKQTDLIGQKQYNVTYKTRNTFDMVGECSYNYLNNNTLHHVTYNELVMVIEFIATISNTSNLNSYMVNRILAESIINGVINNIDVSILNTRTISNTITNSSDLIGLLTNVKYGTINIGGKFSTTSYAIKRLLIKSNVKCNSYIYTQTIKNIYMTYIVNNTSSIKVISNSYKKRVKKKYITCTITKVHSIEVVV